MPKGRPLPRTKSRPATTHYVYTVEVPDLTLDHHTDFKKPVHPEIIKRAEQELIQLEIASLNLENISEAGARSQSENYRPSIPDKFTLDGKNFRKYLTKKFEKRICIDLAEGQSLSKALTFSGEKISYSQILLI